MKRQKLLRTVSISLVICLFATLFSNGILADSPNSQSSSQQSRGYNQSSGQNVFEQNTIDTLNNYVEVNSNGILYFNIPADVSNQLGLDQIQMAQKCLDLTNAKISNKQLAVTENGTIYNPNDDSEYTQAYESGYQYYWWGLRTWWTQSQATQGAYNLTQMALGFGISAGASAAAGFFFPFFFGFAIGLGVGAAYYNEVAASMNYYNNYRGIILDINYWLTYSCYSQGA
jgi:hypothetical protein